MQHLSEAHRRQIMLEEPERVEKIFRARETITPKRYVCYRACGPIVVDGTLNAPWIEDKGWTIEMAFDWKSMAPQCIGVSYPPKHGDQWRVNMSRMHRERGSPHCMD